jgi:hypothetical protein
MRVETMMHDDGISADMAAIERAVWRDNGRDYGDVIPPARRAPVSLFSCVLGLLIRTIKRATGGRATEAPLRRTDCGGPRL